MTNTHACDNCLGIQPETCLFNPNRHMLHKMPMSEKAPVEAGERFVSMRTGNVVLVVRVRRPRGTSSEWAAEVLDGLERKWLTCSKDGIRGYRRKP